MAAQFYFSYAPANRDAYLRRFFEDLSARVREYLPALDDEVGFFDSQSAIGEEWGLRAAAVLQSGQAFVALLSPAYFRTERCGKEWQLFRSRFETGRDDRSRIIPVFWVPVDVRALPDSVKEMIELKQHPFPGSQLEAGLRALMRLGKSGAYGEALDILAKLLVQQIQRPALARPPELPSMAQTANAFGNFMPQTEPSKSVITVPFAGSRAELSRERSFVEGYGGAPGRDWRPFLPVTPHRVETITQTIAAQEGLLCEYLAPDSQLSERITDTRTRTRPVIILVDPWTVMLDEYHRLLKKLDRITTPNVSISLVANLEDEQTNNRREELEETVRKILSDSRGGKDALAVVYNEGELSAFFRNSLVDGFARILRGVGVERRIKSPLALPTLTGPGKSW